MQYVIIDIWTWKNNSNLIFIFSKIKFYHVQMSSFLLLGIKNIKYLPVESIRNIKKKEY